MGIERSGRKPKRQRTTAQRLKGRRTIVFDLPQEGPAKKSEKPKEPAKKASAKKAAAKKPAKKAAE